VSDGFFSRVGRAARLLADPRTPKLPKLALIAAVAYVLSPIDLVPEAVLPVVGWLDDILVGLAALRWLLKQEGVPRRAPEAVSAAEGPPAAPPH